MQVDFYTFKNEDFTCSKCGWTGKGRQLSHGDFSEEHFIGDLDCPSCGEHIGFWQTPSIGDAKKWKKENPGIDGGGGGL